MKIKVIMTELAILSHRDSCHNHHQGFLRTRGRQPANMDPDPHGLVGQDLKQDPI